MNLTLKNRRLLLGPGTQTKPAPPSESAGAHFRHSSIENPIPNQNTKSQITSGSPPLVFRPYQREAFENKIHGLEVWLWGRQTGKSFTLAAWAVDRLLNNPGRLVTILSNSKSNGMELNLKCAEVCRLFAVAYEQLDLSNETVGMASSPSQTSFSTRNTELGTRNFPNTTRNTTTLRDHASSERLAHVGTQLVAGLGSQPQDQSGASESWRPWEGKLGTRNFPNATRNTEPGTRNRSESSLSIQTFHYETRITINGVVGRIKVLPANPRTARGFSGDLILDEFAFHENSAAIWEAAEPILSAHPDYLCRVASTPNGRHNMFYRLATDPKIPLRRVTRSDAYKQGLQIFHPITREPITPDQARELAMDKHAYDQNYECIFESENMALLTYDLISQAERPNIGFICTHDWSSECIGFLSNPKSQIQIPNENTNPVGNAASPARTSTASQTSPSSNPGQCTQPCQPNSEHGTRNKELYLGVDVGRNRDMTVITVLEKSGQSLLVRAILRLSDMRLPEQQERLAVICRLPGFRGACIDMTGLGLGLYEYTQKQFGYRIRGINFSSNLPLNNILQTRNTLCGIPNPKSQMPNTAPAPEVLALGLLAAYEDRRIQHPIDEQLREDLRKPERLLSPSGRVSIAATRDGAGHADHFWSMALAVHAAQGQPDIYIHVVKRKNPFMWIDRKRLMG